MSASFDAFDLGQAAREVALVTAMYLIREHGDPDAAIDGLVATGIGTKGAEVLDAQAIAAQAIRDAVEMGVVGR